jgi:hypothetical protein
MLELGADVNLKTEDGITSMHWACGLGDEPINKQIIELLLANGGNPNVKSVDGVTPVHVSASWGFSNILKALVCHGGDPWIEDEDGNNSWDLALQKNQWMVLKYLASYMEQEPVESVADTSVQCIFVGHREVKDTSCISASANSSIGSNNVGFLESINSALSFSCSSLNNAICNPDSTTTSSSSVVIVEELLHTDSDKGVNLIEWHYPPLLNQDTITDATLNEALCSTEEKDSFMDSQVLIDELKSLGTTPGPITATTKNIYLRQLYRLRKEQAVQAPSPQRLGLSKELQSLVHSYPGNENDMKIASQLDRLLVTHFSCPDPSKPWREGLSKKSFNYLLLDPRVTHNLPLNESQDQSLLFKRFISSIFYIGKGKQVRPHEHLYEATKLRNRPQGFVKVIPQRLN